MAVAGLATPVTLAATYDLVGRRTSLGAEIDGTDDFVNEYTWDSLSRLSQLTQQSQSGGNAVAEKRVDLTYKLDGQFASLSRYADLAGTELVATSAYGYDTAGRLNALIHADQLLPLPLGEGWGEGALAGYRYTWDDVNRITSIDSYVDGLVDYDYDSASQLTGADYSSQTDENYSYDDNGNREVANGDTYTTGSNNQLQDDDTYTYEYDEEGNRTKQIAADGSYRTFEWDHRNRLIAVADFDDEDNRLLRVEYTYDAFDSLVGRKVFEGESSTPSESGHFVYDGQQIVLVLDDEGDVENRYLWGPQVDQLLAQEDGAGDVLWALSDHQNTVRDWAEYDTGTTTVVDHAEYDSFGNRLNAAAVAAAFGWTGRYRDEATGLQYNWRRWYDPGVGRWLSQDPARTPPQNLYAYVGNSPAIFVDPWGLAGWNDPPDEWIIPPGTNPDFPGGLPGFDAPILPPDIIWPAPPPPPDNSIHLPDDNTFWMFLQGMCMIVGGWWAGGSAADEVPTIIKFPGPRQPPTVPPYAGPPVTQIGPDTWLVGGRIIRIPPEFPRIFIR